MLLYPSFLKSLGTSICRGFRRIGAPVWMSFLAIFFIHGSFSYWTLPSWIPDPTFPIYTNKIHKVCGYCVANFHACEPPIKRMLSKAAPKRGEHPCVALLHDAVQYLPHRLCAIIVTDWHPQHGLKPSISISAAFPSCAVELPDCCSWSN